MVSAVEVPGFYSHLFVVPKPGGSWRPVFDLSTLNKYLHPIKFHMETAQGLRCSINRNDLAVSLDLSDGVSSGSSKQAEQQRGVPVPPGGKSQLCVAGPSSSPPRMLRLIDPPGLHRPAHELRALSASLALLRGVLLGELISDVGWASGFTFAQFYLHHLGLSKKDDLPSSLRLPVTL